MMPTLPLQTLKIYLISFLFSTLFLSPVVATYAQASEAGILKVAFATEELSVTVAWDTFISAGHWVEISVLDEFQSPVESRLILPTPGAVTSTSFTGFGGDPQNAGAQFTVEIRDIFGQLLAEPLPFRTGYRCDGPEGPCEPQVIQGIKSSTPIARETLMEALDGAEQAQSNDLLRHVLLTRPGLAGEIISMAKQLKRLDDQHALGPDCFCHWIYHFKDSDETCGKTGPGRDRDSSGWVMADRVGKGSGAAIGAQVSFLPEQIQGSASASDRHALDLRCWKISQWEAYPVSSANGPESIMIPFPQLVSCPDGCLGSVETRATVFHDFDARIARETPSLPTHFVEISGAAALSVVDPTQNDPPTWGAWHADAGCRDGSCETSEGRIPLPQSGQLMLADTGRMVATVSGNLDLTLKATEEGQWSYGRAEFRTVQLEVTATALCTVEPEVTVTYTHHAFQDPNINGQCGELEIDPWVD